jgi:hypothetical protein
VCERRASCCYGAVWRFTFKKFVAQLTMKGMPYGLTKAIQLKRSSWNASLACEGTRFVQYINHQRKGENNQTPHCTGRPAHILNGEQPLTRENKFHEMGPNKQKQTHHSHHDQLRVHPWENMQERLHDASHSFPVR